MKRSDNLHLSQVRTGAFIMVAVLLFAAGILMMGDKTKMFVEKDDLSVIMTDVAGLKVGAPVWLAGVDVGLVTSIRFENPERTNEIDVSLQVSKDSLKKIGADSRVTIKTRGLMGEKYVDITPGQRYAETPLTRIAARVLRLLGGAQGSISRMPFAGGWTLGREMPAPQGKTFRELYAARKRAA